MDTVFSIEFISWTGQKVTVDAGRTDPRPADEYTSHDIKIAVKGEYVGAIRRAANGWYYDLFSKRMLGACVPTMMDCVAKLMDDLGCRDKIMESE